MICQPAWQLAMTIGLPSASGCRAATSSMKIASARQTSSIVCPGIGFGEKADEITRMAGGERDADLAVRLHAADARTVAGARVDDDDRRLGGIDRDAGRRNDARKPVVDRALQGPPVPHQFCLKVEHMRDFLRGVLMVIIASFSQRIQKQDAALPCVRPIFLH